MNKRYHSFLIAFVLLLSLQADNVSGLSGYNALDCLDRYCYVPRNIVIDPTPQYGIYEYVFYEQYLSCLNSTAVAGCQECQAFWNNDPSLDLPESCTTCATKCLDQVMLSQDFNKSETGAKKFSQYIGQCRVDCYKTATFPQTSDYQTRVAGDIRGYTNCVNQLLLSGEYNLKTQFYKDYKICREFTKQCKAANRLLAAKKPTDRYPLESFICFDSCSPVEQDSDLEGFYIAEEFKCMQVNQTEIPPELTDPIPSQSFTYQVFESCLTKNQLSCPPQGNPSYNNSCSELITGFENEINTRLEGTDCKKDLDTLDSCLQDKSERTYRFPKSCSAFYEQVFDTNFPEFPQDAQKIFLPFYKDTLIACAKTGKPPQNSVLIRPAEYQSCLNACNQCEDYICVRLVQRQEQCMKVNTSAQCQASLPGQSPLLPVTYAQTACRHSCINTYIDEFAAYQSFVNTVKCQVQCYQAGNKNYFFYQRITECVRDYLPEAFKNQAEHTAIIKLRACYQDVRANNSACKGRLETDFVDLGCSEALARCADEIEFPEDYASFYDYVASTYLSCVRQGNPLASTKVVAGLSQEVQACTKTARDKLSGTFSSEANDYQSCVENSTQSVCVLGKTAFQKQINDKVLSTVPLQRAICAYSCRADPKTQNNLTTYLNDYESCLVSEEKSSVLQNFNLSRVDSCIQRQVPQEQTDSPFSDCTKKLTKGQICTANCTVASQSLDRVRKECFNCLRDFTTKDSEFKEKCNDTTFLDYVKTPFLNCHGINDYPIPEDSMPTIKDVDHCLQISCLNLRSSCQRNSSCKADYEKYQQCVDPETNQSKDNQLFVSALEYYLRKLKSPENKYPTERRSTRMYCSKKISEDSLASTLVACEKSCVLQGKMDNTELLDFTFKKVEDCLAFQVPRLQVDASSWVSYQQCLKSEEIPSCKLCNKIEPIDRIQSEDKPYYEVCQQCRITCTRNQVFTSAISPILNLQCLNQAYISDELKETLLSSTTFVEEAEACLASAPVQALNSSCDSSVDCKAKRDAHQDPRNLAFDVCANAFDIYNQMLASPEKRQMRVPFEMQTCVYARQPLSYESSAEWRNLYAAIQSCYMFGKTGQTPQPARLAHFYITAQQNIQQYCYIPDSENAPLSRAFELYFECMFQDEFYAPCKACQEDFQKGFNRLVLATCVQCQQLCRLKIIRQNFIEDAKFEEYTFNCHFHAIAEREYQKSISLTQKLSGTKIGFQSYYDLARLRRLIDTTTQEYKSFKNCTERLVQCIRAHDSFAALKDTDSVPLELYLCHRTCFPTTLNATYDKIRLQLDTAYSTKTNVLPEGLVYRDVETRGFTEKDFDTCWKNAQFQCPANSPDQGACKRAIDYYNKKKLESKLLKTCQDDRKILQSVNRKILDPALQPFPVSCADYWAERVPRDISIQDFWVIDLYLQPAALGCSADALKPTFESHLAASNAQFAQCVAEQCPVCREQKCLDAQLKFMECQLKESENTDQCQASMEYNYINKSSVFGNDALSFSRVVCRESCLELSSDPSYSEILGCQQRCYLAGKRAPFTYTELNTCINRNSPNSLTSSWSELQQFLNRFRQDILIRCESTCGRFQLTESPEELTQQVTHTCQACLSQLLRTWHTNVTSAPSASTNSTAQAFIQYVHPVYASCASTGAFSNAQLSLRQTIKVQEKCLADAAAACDNDPGCKTWRNDNESSTCERDSFLCRSSESLLKQAQGLEAILTSHYETLLCKKFCTPPKISSSNEATQKAGEKYLRDMEACFLGEPENKPDNSGALVEACIALTVPEPSAKNQPEQKKYFDQLADCRKTCYAAGASPAENPYDCSLKCFREKYPGWSKFREDFVQTYAEKINRCMRVGILPIYEPENVRVSQEGDCEAYECSGCEGDQDCEASRKMFEECLAPQNRSSYCKAAFERYERQKSIGGDVRYPHEMNACKDSCLPEGSLEANKKFREFWTCRRNCSRRSYLSSLTDYSSVRSCLGNLRENITRDPEGSKDYADYEKCFQGNDTAECAKCNKKAPSGDKDLVYDHCARCHYQCVNRFQFKKFPSARSRVTWCWTNGSLSNDSLMHLEMGHSPFTYKSLHTCNSSNCMTPFPNAIDSTLSEINQLYVSCQSSNEVCKRCFEGANANRSKHASLECQQCVIECRDYLREAVSNMTSVSQIDAYLAHFQKYVTDCQLQCTHFGSLQFLEEIRSTTDSVYHCRNQLIQEKKIVFSSKKRNFTYYDNCTRSSVQCRVALQLAKNGVGEDTYPYGLYQCYQSCRPPVGMTDEFKSSWEWEQYCFQKPQAFIAQNQFTISQNTYCEKANMPKCPAGSSCSTRQQLYETYQKILPQCDACNQYLNSRLNTRRSPLTQECKNCKLASLEKVKETPQLDQNTIFTEISEQVIQQCAVNGYVREIIYTKSQATLLSYEQCYSDLCSQHECSKSVQQELCDQNEKAKQSNIAKSTQCAMAEEEMKYYVIYGSPNDPLPQGKAICHESTTITDSKIDFTYLQLQNCISFCLSNYYMPKSLAPPVPVDPIDPVIPSFSGLVQFLALISILIISLLF